MALALVTRATRALSEHVNRFYRVLKGIDYDHLTLKADHAVTPVLIIENDGGGSTLLLNDSAGATVFVAGQEGVISAKMTQSKRTRVQGTALATTDFVLGAGWGTSAAVTAVEGSDGAFRFRVVAGSGAFAANPTIAITFKDGTWTTTPVIVCQQTVGTTSVGIIEQTSVTATAATLTCRFTPATPSEVFWFTVLVVGR